ncbi:hypothetical protein KRMM14A1259_51170 [Krasilnikovia sp. MM14-A1259]
MPQSAVAAPRVTPVAAVAQGPLTVEQALQRLLAGAPEEKNPADNPVDDAGLDRMLAQDLADYDEDPAVREAAKAALATNDPVQIKDFLDNGVPAYRKAAENRKKLDAESNRATVQEWAETGGPRVRQGAKAALDSKDDAKLAQFVATGHDAAELADKQDTLSAAEKAKTIQARVEQLVAHGGYEVQELGQDALDSEDPAVIADFYDNGYKVASAHDADTQQQINDALASRTKAVDDLTDLAQRATQAAQARKKIIENSVAATKELTATANSMALANKQAKQADAIYAADVPVRKQGGKTHTADLTNLRTTTCQDAGRAGEHAGQVAGYAGAASVSAKTLLDTGLTHGLDWADVMQAQADAGAAAKQAAETACHAAEATEAAGKALDADRNATVDANNAVKYRQAAEREQAAAEKLADRAEKLAAAAQAAAKDAHTQRLRAEADADSAQDHADKAAGYYADAKRQRGIARDAAGAAIVHMTRAYKADARANEQQGIVAEKAQKVKEAQERVLALGPKFTKTTDRARILFGKAQKDNENTKAKEFQAQAAESRHLAAQMRCSNPQTSSGCPGTAEMQQLAAEAKQTRSDANAAKTASDQSQKEASAASDEANATGAEARRAAAAAAAAKADAQAAANQAGLARQDAADANAAATKAIKDANKATADARAAAQAARTAISRASAAQSDADLTAKSADDAVRQSAIAAFQSRVSGRAALDARASADGIADPAAAAIDVANAYADTDSDAAMAIDIANDALSIGDAQAASAQKHADDAAAAAVHAAEMADKAQAQVKPAYQAAQKAAEAAARAVKASKVAVEAARDAAGDAKGAVYAANTAQGAAHEAGAWANGAANFAAQAGSDAMSAQQAAVKASGFASQAQKFADNAKLLSDKVTKISSAINEFSDGIWAIAKGLGRAAHDLQDIAWKAYNAEQQAAEVGFIKWFDDKGKWINDHIGGSDVTKGIIDSATGTITGLIYTGHCTIGSFIGADAATDEYSIPEVSPLPKTGDACNLLIDGAKKLVTHPWELVHWSDWKENWKHALGETIFDIGAFVLTDGTSLYGKIVKDGIRQGMKELLKDAAKMSIKDLASVLFKNGAEKMVNAIKELGAVNAARIANLAETIGTKLKVTFSPDEVAAMSRAIKLKGIGAVEDTLRNLKDSPLVKGLEDLLKDCASRNSFAPQTRVLMADGSRKPIVDVRVGDRVLATDPTTGFTKGERVTVLHRNRDTAMADVTVQTRAGQRKTIHTTQEHPFWNATDRVWTDAGKLRPRTALSTTWGSGPRVTKVRLFDGKRTMFNLTVAKLHTYYVFAGGTPVLVHNCNELGDDGLLNLDTYEAIEKAYGSNGTKIAEGVDHMVERMHDGTHNAADHEIPGIGHDPMALAKYLSGWVGKGTHKDVITGSTVVLDEKRGVLIVERVDRIHGYKYTKKQFDEAKTKNGNPRYVPIVP